MKRFRNLLSRNAILAVGAMAALGVGLVYAQDIKTGGTLPEVQTPPVQTPQVQTPPVRTPQVEAPAVRTPEVRTNVRGAVPRAGVNANVQGQNGAQVPGVGKAQVGTQGQLQANVNGRGRRAGLGFKVDARENLGLRISGLEATSAAGRAGFRANDRIISVDGRPFTTAVQFRAYLATQGGRRVPVIIERDNQQYTIELPLDERPMDGAWLGVHLDDSESAASVKGARITRVFPSGPAAQAGLQTGDVIVAFNNQPVGSASDVIVTVQEMQPQTEVEVAILRDNSEMKVPVVLGDRSGFMGRFPQRHGNISQTSGQGNQVNNQAANTGDEDIPPYAMQLEHERRMAEQHERIEDEIR